MSFSPPEYTAAVRRAESAPLYRLRGVIDGRETVIELGEGHHSIGSSRLAGVHLPVFGVSRQHEALEVAEHTIAGHTIDERLLREALHRTGGKKVECSLPGVSRNGLDKRMKRLQIEGQREGQSP
jgi:hypothetical protein